VFPGLRHIVEIDHRRDIDLAGLRVNIRDVDMLFLPAPDGISTALHVFIYLAAVIDANDKPSFQRPGDRLQPRGNCRLDKNLGPFRQGDAQVGRVLF